MARPVGRNEPHLHLAQALKQAQRAVEQALDAALASLDLSVSLYGALFLLAGDSGMSTATLARRAGVKPQSAAHVVARLEELGMVSRTPHPDLGRVLRVRLTTVGRQALAKASMVMVNAEAQLTEGMTGAECDQLLGQLDRLRARTYELDR